MKPDLKVKPLYEDTQIPVRANPTDSGADVFAHNIKKKFVMKRSNDYYDDQREVEDKSDLNFPLVLRSGERALVGTGIAATVGEGYEIQVRSRSGIPLKVGVIVGNAPGTIDVEFRGEIGIILINASKVTQTFNKGDRIAQIVVAPVVIPNMVIVEDLDKTARGDGGFGSTGKN